jgi:hypothetical protein
MKKNLTILVVFLIVLAVALGAYAYQKNNAQPTPDTVGSEQNDEVENGRVMSVEEYVRLNISELSPEKEVLGGTYYVTNIELDSTSSPQAHSGAGTVSYEDGHNAYTADFTYTTDAENGAIAITSFVIRK